jgi:translation elongation factor EF-G
VRVQPIDDSARCFGVFPDQVIDATRKAVRAAVEAAGARLVEAHYLCVVTTAPEALGGCVFNSKLQSARPLCVGGG